MADPSRDTAIGELAIRLGFLTREVLADCLREQEDMERGGQRLHIGQIFVRRRLLNADQLAVLLREQTGSGVPPRYAEPRLLGWGAVGEVYSAVDTVLRRPVAVKLLREDAARSDLVRARFQREAQAAAQLSHPNLVRVLDFGEWEERLFLVMDLVQGRTLSEAWDKGAMPLPARLEVLAKVADAVQALHERGLVHRDVKPANVLLDTLQEPHLGDLGLVHAMDSATQLTRSGTPLGTPVYMAPEQALGLPQQMDARTDVYALGAMLYEAVTGRPPFVSESVTDLYFKIVNEEAAPPSRLRPGAPVDLDHVCLKALEKRREARYASAREFAEELRRHLRGEPVVARAAGLPQRLRRRIRRHPAVAGSALAAALAVLAVAVFVARQHARAKLEETLRSQVAAELEDIDRWDQNLYKPGTVIPRVAGELSDAVGRLDALLDRRADFAPALYARGKALRRLRRHAEAERDLTRAIDAAPDDPQYRLERARVTLDLFCEICHVRDLQEAIIARSGGAWEARLRRVREDLESARSAGRLRPWEAEYCTAALALVDLRSPEAGEILTRAIQASPNEPDLHYLRALAYDDFARDESTRRQNVRYIHLALDDALKAFAVKQSYYEAAMLSGWLYFCVSQEEQLQEPDRHRSLKEGWSLMEQATAIDPDRYEAHYMLGHAYFWSHRNGHTPLSATESLERAAENFERSVRLAPWNDLARFWGIHARARAAATHPDDEAIVLLQRLPDHVPVSPKVTGSHYFEFILGWTAWQLAIRLHRQGRDATAAFERALDKLTTSIRKNQNPGLVPEVMESVIAMAVDYARARPSDAGRIYESSARSLDGVSLKDVPPSLAAQAAELYGEWGETAKLGAAAEGCLRFASQAGDLPRAVAWRGVAKLWKGDRAGARADLEAAVKADGALLDRFGAWLEESRR